MIKQTVLDNGLTVISEVMPAVETVSVGVYVRTGSRAETAANNGVSHFLEHMAFKGTERRSALDIAAEVEDVGGQMNAYTSTETTAYHLKVLKGDLPLAVDMLGDILLNSTFPEDEIERERGVILQEIGQSKDTPSDVVFDHLMATAYPNQPVGRPILGTVDTVKAVSRKSLKTYMQSRYTGANMILAAAGNVDHAALVALAKKHFKKLKKGTPNTVTPAKLGRGLMVEKRTLEQVHLALSFGAVGKTDPRIFAANIWNTIVGGGMSSRLFQEIREKRGLVYTVYSYLSPFKDSGIFGIYAGTSAKQVPELLPAALVELKAATHALTKEEIARGRAQIKAGILMSLESTDARMGRLARDVFLYGKPVPVAEVVRRIDAVTRDDLHAIGNYILNPKTATLAAVGPIDKAKLQKLWEKALA